MGDAWHGTRFRLLEHVGCDMYRRDKGVYSFWHEMRAGFFWYTPAHVIGHARWKEEKKDLSKGKKVITI